MPSVKVQELEMASAIEMARAQGGRVYPITFSAVTPKLEAVRLSDVLYVPSALEIGQSLQIIGGRYLPIEALFDQWTPWFVKPRILERGISEFDQFAESDHDGDVCILGNLFSRNFTHCHEEMMKVVALEQAKFECRYVLSDLPAFARELLAILGVAAERILEVRSPTRFRSVLFSTPVSYRNVADYPDVLLDLRARLLQAGAGEHREYGTRLWLDRGAQTRLGRRLVNEEDVHRLLERYGFQRLDMGALPVREQISVASKMQVMSGLHGSQFVHSQLMPGRSHVIECFSPLYLNPTYTDIYRVLRHRYSQVTNTNTHIFPDVHGGDVMVDCQQLDLALRNASED
jgi:hypothetical protein